jgi:plastocyanin
MIGICLAQNPKVHHIIIEGMKFTPQTLTVELNDTVIWHNKDFFPHTVTSKDKTFNSTGIPVNGSWQLILKKQGTYNYKCIFHPIMTGSLIVIDTI